MIEVSEEAMDWYKTLNQLNGIAQAQCKGNLQTRGDRDSKESGKSIKTKQDS